MQDKVRDKGNVLKGKIPLKNSKIYLRKKVKQLDNLVKKNTKPNVCMISFNCHSGPALHKKQLTSKFFLGNRNDDYILGKNIYKLLEKLNHKAAIFFFANSCDLPANIKIRERNYKNRSALIPDTPMLLPDLPLLNAMDTYENDTNIRNTNSSEQAMVTFAPSKATNSYPFIKIFNSKNYRYISNDECAYGSYFVQAMITAYNPQQTYFQHLLEADIRLSDTIKQMQIAGTIEMPQPQSVEIYLANRKSFLGYEIKSQKILQEYLGLQAFCNQLNQP
jgi:hypothetical protein